MRTFIGFCRAFLLALLAFCTAGVARAQDADQTTPRHGRSYWLLGSVVKVPDGVYTSNGSEGYSVEFVTGETPFKIRITFLERPEFGGDFNVIQGSVPATGEVSVSVFGPGFEGYCTHGQRGKVHLTIKDKQHFYFDARDLEVEFRKSSKRERLSFSLKLPSAVPVSEE